MEKLLLKPYSQLTAGIAAAMNNLFTGKRLWATLLSLLTFLFVAGFNQPSQAQVLYYLGSDGALTNNTNDGIYKVNQDGTNLQRLVSSVSAPQGMVIDAPNNRAFVASYGTGTTVTANGIYKIDLSSGVQTLLYSSSTSNRVANLAYDAALQYLYFTTNDGTNGTTVGGDALNRVNVNTGGVEVLAQSIGALPTFISFDAPRSRVYVYDGAASPRFLTYTTSGQLISSVSMPSLIKGMSYDEKSQIIYYTVDDGTTTAANTDGLYKSAPENISSTGTQIAGALCENPGHLTIDRVNNAAFVWNTYASSRRIVKVNLSNGTFATLPVSGSSGPVAFAVNNQVTAFSVPAPSKIATLNSLNISAGSINFNAGTKSYSTSVASEVSSITVTPTVTNAGATVTVNGVSVASGSSSGALALSIGSNTITTTVTAEDGLTTESYVITVTRPASNDANLSSIVVGNGTLNPSFSSNTTSYTVSVPNSQSSLNLTAYVNQPNATFKVSGASIASGQNISYNLYVGINNINYVVTAQDGTTTKTYSIVATRAKADQTITLASSASKTYGDADYSPGATSSSGLGVSYSSSNTAVATIVNNNVHIVGVGTTTITASQAGNTSYNAATSVTQTLTIDAKPITVTANANQTKVYGNADPTFTYTAPGVVSGDNPTGGLARAAGSNVGAYAINIGTLSYGNKYSVTFVPADFNITKRPLTIAPLPVTKIYGQTDFATGAPYGLGATSVAPGDAMTGSFGRDNTSENVGVYNLTLGAKHPVNPSTGQDLSANYDITFVSNTFTIAAKALTVTANANQSKTYGAADPTLTYSSTGLAFSDQFTGSLSRNTGENVGNYGITQGSLTAGSNYSLTFASAAFAVTPASLTITADDKTRFVGEQNPSLTYQVAGFQNGDNESSLTPGVSVSTTATNTSVAGTYPITVSGATNPNYNIAFTPGTLTVNALSADATLSNLITNIGTLTPSFDPNTTDYEVSVGEGVTSIYVIPTVNSAYASVQVNYSPVTSGSPSSVYISPGDNPIPVLVTAQDGTTKQYNLNVKAPLSNNAKLSGIYYFIGDNFSSVPGFDPEVHSYTLNVTNDVMSARLIPFGEDYNARITINGSPYDGYFAPYLNGGANVFTFVVASQDGTTTETYTLTINRALSSNNNLAALSIDHGSLSPIFNAGVTLYSAAVPSTVYSINLTASVADTTARVKVNNESFVNYANKNISLQGGDNTITTTVTAPNGDTKDYIIVVSKALSSDATLSNLTTNAGPLSPAFSPGTTVYSQTALATRSTIDVTPTANAATTSITVNGNTAVSGNAVSVPVNYGANTISVATTAEDGTTATYTLNVNRPLPATDPSISLSISPVFPLTATTGPANENYKTIVSPSVSSISVVPVSADGKAMVTVNGTQVQSGSPSGQIAIPYGTTLITVNSVAEDGVAAKSYSISVTRYLSSKAILSYIETTPKLLLERQSDVPSLAIYNGTVGAGVSSITIKPTLQDTTARMTINGVPAADKQYSSPFDLVAGNNVIDIKVTAANGVTTKIYRLNITRAISNPPVITTIETDPKVTLALQSNTDTVSVYSGTVSSATSTIRVKPTAGGTASGVTVNGVATADGTFSAPISLVAGNNVIDLTVTAADNATTKTYRLNITRTISPTPVLATIETDPKVSLALQSKTDALYIYNTTVVVGTSSIKIKPTLKGTALGITVNGTATADATYTEPVALVVGNNVIDVKVTAIDGSTNRIYRLNVKRPAPVVPVLATIETDPKVSLALQSNTDTLSVYNATVGVAVSSISVKPTLKSAATGITVNGSANADATYSSPVSLVPGSNVIDIKVTALDGVTTKTYRLNISRTIAATPILATIEIDPKVALKLQSRNSTLSIYTATVAGGVSSIRIKPTLKDAGPAIDINGTPASNAVLSSPVALSVGANTIDIKLTAADGITTNTYRLNITRQTPSSNADLAAAEISQYEYPNFIGTPVTLTETSPGTFSGTIYATTFPFRIRYKTTSSSANATMSMFGFANMPNGQYADVTTSFPNYDSVNMLVTVKAEDGVTTRNYTLQITVAPPPQNLAGTKDAIRIVSKTTNSFVATDDVVVHPGVSPNGDGTNDFLVIEGLSNTTSNKLAVMNAAGTLVFETKDYGKDGSNVFNGRARNGSMLQAGTYYYALEYQVGKETKRKTGYLVLKY